MRGGGGQRRSGGSSSQGLTATCKYVDRLMFISSLGLAAEIVVWSDKGPKQP
jgi:hypothetical protein